MCIASGVHRLVTMEGMGKVKFKTLKELYDVTEEVSFPTQVTMELEEDLHLQSTNNQVDGSLSLTVPFRFEIEKKSGTCNLCATRCSSCMHFERVAAIVGVGTGDFTNKASEEKRSSQCSSNGDLLFSPLSSVCDCRQRTSSEASNVFSVSLSRDSFSENADSGATFRGSDPCDDLELLLNIRNAQPARESSNSLKGLINFHNQRFSKKHIELETLGDSISCISRSDSTNLTVCNNNADADGKNAFCSSASVDGFPAVEKDVNDKLVCLYVGVTRFDKASGNHCNFHIFTEEPPLTGVVLTNRSDQSDASSLKDFCDRAISPKGELSEYSGEQAESSLAVAATSQFSVQIDGVHNCGAFGKSIPHLNCEDPAIESVCHSYCKKHLQKSVVVIENTSMQQPWQSQPADPKGVSDLMEDEVSVCDICGDAGREELLAICSKCDDGAEHIYCMRVKLDKVPERDWMCEECMLRTDTAQSVQAKVEEAARISKGRLDLQKSGSSVHFESRSSLKFKFKSSFARRSGRDAVSSTSQFSVKGHAAHLEAQAVKVARDIGIRAVSPRSSEPCNNPPLHRDFSYGHIKKGKVEAAKGITSVLQFSHNSQEKAKVSYVCDEKIKRHASTLEAELDKKKRALETEDISPKVKVCHNSQEKAKVSLVCDEKIKRCASILEAELNKRMRALETEDISPKVKVSHNFQEKAKVSHVCDEKIKRRASTLEAELDKKKRALETEDISPNVSKPSTHSPLSREPSFKNLVKAKVKAAHSVTSGEQSLYGTDATAELPSTLCDKSAKLGSQTEISWDRRSLLKSRSSNAADLKLKGVGHLAESDCLQKQKAARNPAFHDNRIRSDLRVVSKSLSFSTVSTDKLNAAGSEVVQANASRPETLKELSHAKETKTAKENVTSELCKPAMRSTASNSRVHSIQSEKETKPGDETFLSKSYCHKVGAVQSCRQLDSILKPSSSVTHEDLNCPNEEKRNESWQAERPTRVANSTEAHNLFTGLASDERSSLRNLPQFDKAILSQDSIIPMPHFLWQGKFQIHSSEGPASSCDRIQAHLSTFASPKVLEVAERLPEIIILEKLPRLRLWPSQFIEHGVTEENIGLYFFADNLNSYREYYRNLLDYVTKYDLALKGNINGVELLIFSSFVLPEASRYWNTMLYLWGVFRGRKVDHSVNIGASNSQKEENRDSGRRRAFDLNAFPQHGKYIARAEEGVNCCSTNGCPSEVHDLDSTDTNVLGDRILLGGYNYGSGIPEPWQALNKGGENNPEMPDLDLSPGPESEMPKDGPWVSVGIVGNKTNKEVHGKQLMGDKNDTDNGEPSGSGSHSLSLASPPLCLQNLELLERLAVDSLLSLSKSRGVRKV